MIRQPAGIGLPADLGYFFAGFGAFGFAAGFFAAAALADAPALPAFAALAGFCLRLRVAAGKGQGKDGSSNG